MKNIGALRSLRLGGEYDNPIWNLDFSKGKILLGRIIDVPPVVNEPPKNARSLGDHFR